MISQSYDVQWGRAKQIALADIVASGSEPEMKELLAQRTQETPQPQKQHPVIPQPAKSKPSTKPQSQKQAKKKRARVLRVASPPSASPRPASLQPSTETVQPQSTVSDETFPPQSTSSDDTVPRYDAMPVSNTVQRQEKTGFSSTELQESIFATLTPVSTPDQVPQPLAPLPPNQVTPHTMMRHITPSPNRRQDTALTSTSPLTPTRASQDLQDSPIRTLSLSTVVEQQPTVPTSSSSRTRTSPSVTLPRPQTRTPFRPVRPFQSPSMGQILNVLNVIVEQQRVSNKKQDDIVKAIAATNKRLTENTVVQVRLERKVDQLLSERATANVAEPIAQVQVTPADIENIPSEFALGSDLLDTLRRTSTCPGHFAAQTLPTVFPELFGPDQLRLLYNWDGKLP